MIFVITGTEVYQFDRLIRQIDQLKKEHILNDDIYIQLGSCTYAPEYCRWDKWLSFDKMCDNIKNASMVIAHAGAGTTLLCLELGKTPIIVTRQKRHKEHLDDHQIPFAKMMEKLDYAFAAYDVNQISNCIQKMLKRKDEIKNYKKDNSKLINYLDNWVI